MPEQTISIPLNPTDDYGFFNHDLGSSIGQIFSPSANQFLGYADLWLASLSQRGGGWLRYILPLSFGDEVLLAKIRYAVFDKVHEGTLSWQLAVRIMAHLALDSAGPTTYQEAYDQSEDDATVAEVSYSLPQGGPGSQYDTDDISSVIQEIIDQSSWASGNNITLLWRTWAPSSVGSIQHQHVEIMSQYLIDSIAETHPTREAFPWLFTEEYLPTLEITYLPGVPPFTGYDKKVIHDLVIEQDILATGNKETVEHVLTIEQDIEFVHDNIRALEHTLTITQDIDLIGTVTKHVEDLLVISQIIIEAEVESRSVEHEVVITQDIIGNTYFQKHVVSELIVENDEVTGVYVYTRDVESTLDIVTENHNTPMFQRDVQHTLTFIQDYYIEAILSDPEFVESVLVIEQDIPQPNAVRTRAVESEITIGHSVLGYFDFMSASGGAGGGPGGEGADGGSEGGGAVYSGSGAGCVRPDIEYSPFADASVNFPVEPVLAEQDLVIQYPPTSPSLSITLPRPLFSNREELTLTRIQRYTRGGNIKTYTDDSWVKIKIFRYKFEGLDYTKMEEMFTFLSNTLGLQVRVIDHEGRSWDGFIVNPGGESGQFFRQCGRTTEFDFEIG